MATPKSHKKKSGGAQPAARKPKKTGIHVAPTQRGGVVFEKEEFHPLQPTGPGPTKAADGKTIYKVVVVETVTHELEIKADYGEVRQLAQAAINARHEASELPGKVRERTVVVQHVF